MGQYFTAPLCYNKQQVGGIRMRLLVGPKFTKEILNSLALKISRKNIKVQLFDDKIYFDDFENVLKSFGFYKYNSVFGKLYTDNHICLATSIEDRVYLYPEYTTLCDNYATRKRLQKRLSTFSPCTINDPYLYLPILCGLEKVSEVLDLPIEENLIVVSENLRLRIQSQSFSTSLTFLTA